MEIGLRAKGIIKKNIIDQPLVSVITVTKNSENCIEKTIKSVLGQTYKNIEYIIIDGSSKDNTLDVIKKFQENIDYVLSEKDNGLWDAMNKGIGLAKGKILGILNADDIYYPNTIETVVKYFTSNNNIDFIFGSVFKHNLKYGYKPWKIKFSFGFYTTHSVGFFIKSDAQNKIGKYNAKYLSADFDLFYRMIVKEKMIGISSKKDEVFGEFAPGGYSSKVNFIDHLIDMNKIRIDNGQNRIFVNILFFYKIIKNIKKFYKALKSYKKIKY